MCAYWANAAEFVSVDRLHKFEEDEQTKKMLLQAAEQAAEMNAAASDKVDDAPQSPLSDKPGLCLRVYGTMTTESSTNICA